MDTSATGKFQRESRCQICICSSADPLFRYAGLKPPLKHLQIPFHLLTVKQYSGFRAECGMLPPLQFFEGAAIFWRIQLRFWKLFCFKFYIYIYIFLMCDFYRLWGEICTRLQKTSGIVQSFSSGHILLCFCRFYFQVEPARVDRRL